MRLLDQVQDWLISYRAIKPQHLWLQFILDKNLQFNLQLLQKLYKNQKYKAKSGTGTFSQLKHQVGLIFQQYFERSCHIHHHHCPGLLSKFMRIFFNKDHKRCHSEMLTKVHVLYPLSKRSYVSLLILSSNYSEKKMGINQQRRLRKRSCKNVVIYLIICQYYNFYYMVSIYNSEN